MIEAVKPEVEVEGGQEELLEKGRQRVIALIRERDAFALHAQQQIAAYNGGINALISVIGPVEVPAEG